MIEQCAFAVTPTYTHTTRCLYPSKMREVGETQLCLTSVLLCVEQHKKKTTPRHRQSKESSPVAVKRASSTPSSITSTLHLFSIGYASAATATAAYFGSPLDT